MTVDTNSRLIPPPAVTKAILAGLHHQAAGLVADALTFPVRPTELVAEPAYRGRHRTSEEVATRYISSGTVARATEAPMPLPTRDPGTAVPAEVAFPRPNPLNRALGGLRVLRNRGPW